MSSSPSSPSSSDFVKARWLGICSRIGMEPRVTEEIWLTISTMYSEKQRFYHTVDHLRDLFHKKESMKLEIANDVVFDLSIIFHDIVYDPKSSTNEEDSEKIFASLCAKYVSQEVLDKTKDYIIKTKAHDVFQSPDYDLKLFIDLDMSILSDDTDRYRAYAVEIRNEYIHVEPGDYCSKRSKFLRHTLQSAQLFASREFVFGDVRARENIAWEVEELENHRIPGGR